MSCCFLFLFLFSFSLFVHVVFVLSLGYMIFSLFSLFFFLTLSWASPPFFFFLPFFCLSSFDYIPNIPLFNCGIFPLDNPCVGHDRAMHDERMVVSRNAEGLFWGCGGNR